MNFRVQPVKGIFRPSIYHYQLGAAEAVPNFKRYIGLLFFLSVCVYALSAGLGIGSGSISKELTSLSISEFEARKQLFLIGRILLGLFSAAFFLFAVSLYFWAFIEVDYRKIVVVQMSVFCLYLLEKIVEIPLFLLLDVTGISNPLSFGVIAQYLTDYKLVIEIVSNITIFQIAMISITCYYLFRLTSISKVKGILMVFIFYLFTWVIAGLFAMIKIDLFL
ncbi:MAG: hypothetical protein ACI4XL_10575 [Bacillus sp. (in: firmicutes)]